MLELLLEPFSYDYMFKAIALSGVIGAVCAFLSSYLMLKGWSLIGDALSHAVVPGVALAYAFSLPYAMGAFFSGFFATLAINVQSIILGNILGIADEDVNQVLIILGVTIVLLLFYWKDLLLVFFDEVQAKAVGISPLKLKIIFFSLLSACVVTALQSVGAILVISMVVTPGATAYLLTDRFGKLLIISTLLGGITSIVGAYISYYIDGATGGCIVALQTLIFLIAFFFSPKYGLIPRRFANQSAKTTACEAGQGGSL